MTDDRMEELVHDIVSQVDDIIKPQRMGLDEALEFVAYLIEELDVVKGAIEEDIERRAQQ